MTLSINKLHVDIPPSLGARKQAILRLLNTELIKRTWPSGNVSYVNVPSVSISPAQTNIFIAKTIANAMHDAVIQNVRKGVSR